MECRITFKRTNDFRVFYNESYKTYQDFYKYVSGNYIETFYLSVKKEKYIKCFNDLNNYVFTEKFLGLKSIILKNNLNRMISIDFTNMTEYLPELQHMHLTNFELINLGQLSTKIKYLYLKKCQINDVLTSEIFHEGLVDLVLYKNSYEQISETLHFGHLKNLEHFWITNMKFHKLPLLPVMHQKLSSLILTSIKCAESEWSELKLPECLKNLNITSNRIKTFPVLPRNIKILNIGLNEATRFPRNLLMCRNLTDLIYDDELIVPTIQEMRFLRFLETDNIYNDEQNVHNTTVQKSLVASCRNLFTDTFEDVAFESTGNWRADQVIRTDIMQNAEVHVVLHITLCELFQKVWNRIHNSSPEIRTELVNRLIEEMQDCEAEQICFTGKFARVINVLNGYYPDIEIQIGTSDQIMAKINNHFSQHGDLKRDVLFQELLEIDVAPSVIESYIQEFQNSIESN